MRGRAIVVALLLNGNVGKVSQRCSPLVSPAKGDIDVSNEIREGTCCMAAPSQ